MNALDALPKNKTVPFSRGILLMKENSNRLVVSYRLPFHVEGALTKFWRTRFCNAFLC